MRALASAVAVVTLVGCGLALLTALLALRLHEAGFDARAVGVNTAAGGIATLVGAPFIPVAARRFGVAALLLASIAGGVAAVIGFTLTNDYFAWFALRFVIGLSATAMFVLSEFWIATWAPPARRGLVIGIYVSSLAAGFGIGPLLLLVTGTAGDLPFYAGGLLLLASALPLAVNAGDAPRVAAPSRLNLLSVVREAPVAMLAAALHGAIEIAGMGLLPVYALRAGYGPGQGALFVSLFIIGSSTLQLPIGMVADRFDRARLLRLLALGGLGGALLLAVLGAASLPLFAVLLLLWGGMVGALYPVGLGEIGTRYQGSDLASANSAYVMAYAGGMLVGPPFVGEGLDLRPPSGFFWAVAVMIVAYLAVAYARSRFVAAARLTARRASPFP